MRICFAVLLCCVACSQPSPDAPIEAAKAERFVAYRAKLVPLAQRWATQKQDGDVQGTLAQQMEAAREAAGLTDRDVNALSELGTLIALRDDALKRELATQLTAAEKAAPNKPEAAREAGRYLERLRQLQSNLVDLAQVREKYGDPIVDAMLKERAALQRQHTELAKLQ